LGGGAIVDELPKGWEFVTISEIATETEQRKPELTEEFIYIDIASINRDSKKIETPQVLLGKDAPSRARKIVKEGDIIVSTTRPNLNAVALIDSEFDNQIASTGFDVLRPFAIDSSLLFFLVRSQDFVQEMSDLVQGALYPAIRSKDIRAFEFSLPPLNEQKRIADRLSLLLTRTDKTKAHLDRIPPLLRRFRQSVLAAAISGKLTEDWREVNGQIFNEYILKPLNELVKEPMRNGKSVRDGDGLSILRLSALRNGKIDWAEVKSGDWTGIDVNRFLVRDGDFLISRGNGSKELVGSGSLVLSPEGDVAFPDTMIRIRPNNSIISSYYLCMIWSTQSVRHGSMSSF
jgi:type I restriction enzyme, S subunit